MKYFLLISFLGTPAFALTIPTCTEIVTNPESMQYEIRDLSARHVAYRYELNLYNHLDNSPACTGEVQSLAAVSCLQRPNGQLSKVKLRIVKNACVHPEES